jgi:hypothetical protein
MFVLKAVLHLDKILVTGYLLWFKKFQGPDIFKI